VFDLVDQSLVLLFKFIEFGIGLLHILMTLVHSVFKFSNLLFKISLISRRLAVLFLVLSKFFFFLLQDLFVVVDFVLDAIKVLSDDSQLFFD